MCTVPDYAQSAAMDRKSLDSYGQMGTAIEVNFMVILDNTFCQNRKVVKHCLIEFFIIVDLLFTDMTVDYGPVFCYPIKGQLTGRN